MADDYPHLIEPGQRVGTIEVGRILAVRGWPEGSARYRRLKQLTEVIDTHFEELTQSDQASHLQEISLEPEPGWQRFGPAQILVDKRVKKVEEKRAFETLLVASGACSTPISTAVRDRLYQDFSAWQRAREKTKSSEASGSDLH